MVSVLRAARVISPFNRAAIAMWAWQHRSEIFGWADYARRALPRLAEGAGADVLAEGRLRARLTADPRTRDARGLDVSVVDGVAHLRGDVETELADAARAIALDSAGVRRVRDELRTPHRIGGRRRHRRRG